MNNIFNDVKKVEYNGEEIKSITTTNGGVIWKKEEPSTNYLTLTALGEGFAFGNSPIFNGDTITVDWGDGTTETLTTLNGKGHSYSDGLTEHIITFIGEVTGLPSGSFYGSRIGEIYIPSTITSFGDGLFNGTSLQNITFSENCQLTQLSNGCFSSCLITSINIPNSIISFGSSCFSYCTNLTSIIIPSNVTSIGDSCFTNCTGLTSVNIPNSITSLRSTCFYNCTNLTSVNIPNTVTSIGTNCFAKCTGLTSITIPSSVISLGGSCFGRDTNLINYELYWEDSAIINYNSGIMPNNTNTVFTIPNGQTANYITYGYPSNKLVERSI